MSENQEQQGLQFSKKTIISLSILLFAMLMLTGILTQVVPPGEYQLDANGKILKDTYEQLGDKMPFWKVFASPVLLFGSSQATLGIGILLFIILIGGTFLVLDKSGVLKYCLSSIAGRYAKKKYLLLALIIFFCMAMGSVMGVLEESLTLVPLAAAICLTLGWDSLMGVGMSLIAVDFGFTAATFNPFTVGIVQKLADIPLFSGTLVRILFFLLVYLVFYGFMALYGKKIEKNPEKSLVYESDKELRKKYADIDSKEILANPNLKAATRLFVVCIGGVFVAAGISFILQQAPFIPESMNEYLGYMPTIAMAVLFPTGGLLAARRAGMVGKQLSSGFWEGVKAIAPAIPMLILILCATFILQEGKIIHTIVHSVYDICQGMTPVVALIVIFAFVLILNAIIGSGSTKAILIMPIVLPLADLLSISSQSVSIAYSMGDGFGNVIYPTSGLMILAISMVGVSYGKFLRWFGKVFIAEMVLCVLFLWFIWKIGY